MPKSFTHQMEPTGPFTPPHLFEGQDTYGLFLTKIGPDWCFDMPKHGKIDELLTCGTELALDYWYQQLAKEPANWKSEMFCTISTKPFEGIAPTATLELIGEHPEKQNSHDYWEPISQQTCWLCEYGTQMGLGGAPKLYLLLSLEKTFTAPEN